MAGLLDIFGTSGQDTMGLLGMSPEDIARSRDDAQAQALYALAGRLFQGGNTGQSIAEGLQLGQKAYKGGMSEAMQSQLQNFQLQDMLRKRKEDEARREQEKQMRLLAPQIFTTTIELCPQELIFIPNTFTPDGDENNNEWAPVFTSGFDPYRFELLVFNRWGQIVWESHNPQSKWDGTYNNSKCQDGIYFWTVTYGVEDTDERKQIQGHLTIIR